MFFCELGDLSSFIPKRHGNGKGGKEMMNRTVLANYGKQSSPYYAWQNACAGFYRRRRVELPSIEQLNFPLWPAAAAQDKDQPMFHERKWIVGACPNAVTTT